jgi:hypothetical protein
VWLTTFIFIKESDMSEKLESNVVDSVANTNFKNLGEFPSMHFQSMMEDNRIISKQMNENLVRGSARLNGALDSLIVRGVKDIAEPDMGEATSVVKMGTGVDPQSQGHLLSQAIAQMASAVGAIQQYAKIAQTTIPVTGQQNTP